MPIYDQAFRRENQYDDFDRYPEDDRIVVLEKWIQIRKGSNDRLHLVKIGKTRMNSTEENIDCRNWYKFLLSSSSQFCLANLPTLMTGRGDLEFSPSELVEYAADWILTKILVQTEIASTRNVADIYSWINIYPGCPDSLMTFAVYMSCDSRDILVHLMNSYGTFGKDLIRKEIMLI